MDIGQPIARVGAIVVAAGRGERFGDAGKIFASLGGKPLLVHSLLTLSAHPDISRTVLVLGDHTLQAGSELVATLGLGDVVICSGGETRTASVRAGLIALGSDYSLVAVHDAARPLVTHAVIDRTLAAAREGGAAVPVIPVSDTIHRALPDDSSGGVLNRTLLRAAQTPQIVRRDRLLQALALIADATDEGGLLQSAGFSVRLVEGDPANIKVTVPADLIIAEALLRHREPGA